ncbi:MerR family transcriptional regulator [Loigolactobacillus jiayinensis]|mgnify:CR=1 FL=1|uniref:MerR family transcriptional regulator n=1 Tax=Loigolactobacillus jiayinensis TaxID=2486016 RepID=A0ABW1RF71_9LACO|nr:MerR family transcriptional regulator [Loigolactobacillus jiayinensis]
MYTIQQLAQLAGVSTRTLRYYDQIGLLPAVRGSNGYRQYGAAEVARLQEIRFLRLFDVELSQIQQIMQQSPLARMQALQQQRTKIVQEQQRLFLLLQTLDQVLDPKKGVMTMTDEEKFAAFKQKQVATNDADYGEEIRAKYGADTVAQSNQKYLKLTTTEMAAMTQTQAELMVTLQQVIVAQDITGTAAKRVFDLHKKWLSYTWPTYLAAAHRGLGEMYVNDPRFTKYYNDGAHSPVAAEWLNRIIQRYATD